jgi:hypothetical protein
VQFVIAIHSHSSQNVGVVKSEVMMDGVCGTGAREKKYVQNLSEDLKGRGQMSISYPNWVSLWLSSVPSGKCRNSTSVRP